MRGVVASVVAGDEDERDGFRSGLDEATTSTLSLFARRRIVQSRRRSSMNLIEEAVDAFALLPATADVPWDTWLKAALFIARSMGRDIASIGSRFGELATEPASERFDVAFEAMNRVESLLQCFIAEVTTTYGTGFIETIVHRDTQSTGAFYSAPRQADDIVPLRTGHQSGASSRRASPTPSTRPGISVPERSSSDQLAGMSFSQQVSGAFLATTGCLSFYVDSSTGDVSFKVVRRRVARHADVEALAAGAEGDDQAVCFDNSSTDPLSWPRRILTMATRRRSTSATTSTSRAHTLRAHRRPWVGTTAGVASRC